MTRAAYSVRRLRRPRRDQRGLVIVYFAMTLTVLLVASAFTVDVGAWYRRAEQIQRAADAAAMAGTTYLPDNPSQAVTTALSVAAANGFTDGANGGTIQVSAAPVVGQPRQLRVDITDSKLPQYFSQTFYGGQSAHRHAVAQYAAPIQLGSPENSFGTGTIYSSTGGNFWAAVDGYCSPREQGDLVMAHSDGEWLNGNTWSCSAATSDTYASSYSTNGYDYQVEVPAGHSKLFIQVYDPAYVPYWYSGFSSATCVSPYNGSSAGPDLYAAGLTTSAYSIETDYTVTDPNGTVEPVKAFPSTETGAGFGQHGDSADACKFVTLATIQSTDYPSGGTYNVNVKTLAGQQGSFGSNAFTLLAVPSVSGQPNTPDNSYQCTTISGSTTPAYSSTCPQIHGSSYMSVLANYTRNNGQLYLARVDSAYAGRTMTINLWDPGEGGQYLQILDNTGATQGFTWSVNPCTSFAGTCTNNAVLASSNGLDVSGTGSQPGSNRQGTSTFNDRMVTITVTIPANYATYAATNNGWWSVNYTQGGNPGTVYQDRTTWSVSVNGTPVHLING